MVMPGEATGHLGGLGIRMADRSPGWHVRPVKRTPLTRKTPLKRSSPLRAKRPEEPTLAPKARTRPTTRKPQKWAEWRSQERGAVVFRAMRHPGSPARCEWPGCQEGGAEWHHLFGRRMEPWSSSRLLTVFSCKKHHDQGHEAAIYRQTWRMQLLIRTKDNWLTWLESVTSLVALGLEDPPMRPDEVEQWLRHAIDVVRAEGIPPPYWNEPEGVI